MYQISNSTNKEGIFETPVYTEDYSKLLDNLLIQYKIIDYYLQVGEITRIQGWILHISVIKSQLFDFFLLIIPFLNSKNVPFKIPRDKDTARCILDGNLGYYKIGKTISIYPNSDKEALELVDELIPLTTSFNGPSILTDIHLGGLVYTRYGGFKPLILSDAMGIQDNYIYGPTGELVKDSYYIPFTVPLGIDWPFAKVISPVHTAPKKTLNKIYRPISILKSDAKGRVLKALYLSHTFHVNWCVIKEAKKNMWSDDAGRDMTDRLVWQHELHNALQDKLPLPRILDRFTESDNIYLVMEYIKGTSLHNYLGSINNNCDSWPRLQLDKRVAILDYLLQVIHLVQTLHEKGYVHRDITPVNFMINNRNRLYLIDNELAYCLNSKKPNPPFLFGTYGFMSPEQLNAQTPTIKEDIYSLGAFMLNILTGISPCTFNILSSEALQKCLLFLIADSTISGLITSCMNSDPDNRPDVTYIQIEIERYKKQIQVKNELTRHSINVNKIDPAQVKSAIDTAIQGLVHPPTLISKDLWQSKVPSKESISGMEITEFTTLTGFREGISGVLYFLGKARKMGFQVDVCQKAYNQSCDFLKNYLNALPNIAPGFYGGAAGIALALATGIDAGLLPNSDENRLGIQKCLELPSTGTNIAIGASGQGLIALQCYSFLEKNAFRKLLSRHLNEVVKSLRKPRRRLFFGEKLTTILNRASFGFGLSGTAYFLVAYSAYFNDPCTEKLAKNLLKSLRKDALLIKQMLLKNGCRGILNGDWLPGDAITGLILTFLKAYETLQLPSYKEIAEDILTIYPANISHDNFTQESGIAGLGELYLEAYRVLKNNEWKNRADWIVELFTHTCKNDNNSLSHWQINNWAFSTADLMIGNSGIIHFLMNYLMIDKPEYRPLYYFN